MKMFGLSPLSILLHPIRTLRWIVTIIPTLNKMKREIGEYGLKGFTNLVMEDELTEDDMEE